MTLRKESVLGKIEFITGVERRRRFSDAERAAVLAKCNEPGATIVGVARLLGISASLIHNWKRMRREAEKIANEPMQFIPYGAMAERRGAAVASAPATSAPPPLSPTLAEELIRPFPGARPGSIDIDLKSGVRLSVDSYANEKALARVLRALREAS